MTPFQRAKQILSISYDTLWVVITYSVSVSVLSLIIPIAAQSLVNIVSFGSLFQPIVVLTTIVIMTLTGASIIRILQASLVETIQQRIFATVALDLAKNLPKISLAMFNKYRGSELVNYFFDVLVVQKTTAVILVSGLEILLQALFSMILLAFYHPILLAFDVFLITALFLVLFLPWKKSLKTAQQESTEKHQVAAWLEEIVNNPSLFKLHGNESFALLKTDERVYDYLIARKKHFVQLLKHLFGCYGIYIVATASLLSIGGFLVIKQQLTLGQLVAAEIVVSVLVSSIVKLGTYLENLYDMLASCGKVGYLFDLPKEETLLKQNLNYNELHQQLLSPPLIEVKNIGFNTDAGHEIFKNINFVLEPHEHIVVYGKKGTGKSALVDTFFGFLFPNQGNISLNCIPFKEYNIAMIRKHFSLVRNIEIFAGTLLENLVLHHKEIEMNLLHYWLREFNMEETLDRLPEGLQTSIGATHNILSTIELQKFMFIRALLVKPSVLVIDCALDLMSKEDIETTLTAIKKGPCQPSIIITTRRNDIFELFQHRVIL